MADYPGNCFAARWRYCSKMRGWAGWFNQRKAVLSSVSAVLITARYFPQQAQTWA
jgi:hypothetical protein